MKDKLTILLTGVGAPGTRGTIYSLRRNDSGTSVTLVGTDIKKSAVGRFWVDEFRTLPPPESDEFIDEVNRVCRKCGVDVILPQTTRETMLFSGALSKVDVPVAVSGSEAVKTANDKSSLLGVFKRLGLPHPRYFAVRGLSELDRCAHQLGYPDLPVVVKPPVSYGSRGFRVLARASTMTTERFLNEKPSATEISLEEFEGMFVRSRSGFPMLLVTEYLPGAEYSVDAFVGERASIAIPRRRDEIVNGISFRTTVENMPDISRLTITVANEIGLRYAFGFQFKLDAANIPKVLECNPRVQGTMVASLFSGVNVIWMAIKEAVGDRPTLKSSKVKHTSFQRYWGGVGMSEDRLIDEV